MQILPRKKCLVYTSENDRQFWIPILLIQMIQLYNKKEAFRNRRIVILEAAQIYLLDPMKNIMHKYKNFCKEARMAPAWMCCIFLTVTSGNPSLDLNYIHTIFPGPSMDKGHMLLGWVSNISNAVRALCSQWEHLFMYCNNIPGPIDTLLWKLMQEWRSIVIGLTGTKLTCHPHCTSILTPITRHANATYGERRSPMLVSCGCVWRSVAPMRASFQKVPSKLQITMWHIVKA